MPHPFVEILGGTMPPANSPRAQAAYDLWNRIHSDMERCIDTCVEDCNEIPSDRNRNFYAVCGLQCLEVYQPHVTKNNYGFGTYITQLSYDFDATWAGHQASPNACPPPASPAQIPVEMSATQADGLENPTGR